MKKKKKSIIQRIELVFCIFSFVLLLCSPLAIVFAQATLSEVNIEVEQIRKQIKSQEKKNESLSMKIDELASLDKIISIAEEQGLSYNNNNIKVVE